MDLEETLSKNDINFAIGNLRRKMDNIADIQSLFKDAGNMFSVLLILIFIGGVGTLISSTNYEHMSAIEDVPVQVPYAIREMDIISNPGNIPTSLLMNGKNIAEYRKVAALSGKRHELMMDEIILENAANHEVLAAKDMVPVLHQLENYYHEKGYIPDEVQLNYPGYNGLVIENTDTGLKRVQKQFVEAFMLRLTHYSQFMREQKAKISAYDAHENHKETRILTDFVDVLGANLLLIFTSWVTRIGLMVYRDGFLERRYQRLFGMESDLVSRS